MLHIPFNEAIISMRSLGLVAAELDTGCPLYPGQMDDDEIHQTQCLDDLEQMMETNCEHQRDQLFGDLVEKMLQLDADLRLKPKELLFW
ncbi:homeodomain-interacting protein kinase 2-like isoform X1 [Lates japonicus]